MIVSVSIDGEEFEFCETDLATKTGATRNPFVLAHGGVAVVKLNHGKYMLIDESELGTFSGKNIYYDVHSGYAMVTLNGKSTRVHRALFSEIPADKVVDHINRDRLDNRSDNLRLCTARENTQNRKLSTRNKCGVPGTYYDGTNDRWVCQINVLHDRCAYGRPTALSKTFRIRDFDGDRERALDAAREWRSEQAKKWGYTS